MRWLVRIFLGIGIVLLLAFAGLLLLPQDRIARFAETRFQAATGRALSLTGGVHATLYPMLGVRTGPIEIANAKWSKSGPMLRAEAMSVGVALGPLLRGDVRIRRVSLSGAQILLEKAADGRANWQFTAPPTPKQAPKAATAGVPAFSLDRGVISDATITYVDHGTGLENKVQNLDLSLGLPDFNGPATVTVSARLNGQAVTLKGRIDSFGPFVNGAVSPATLSLKTGGETIAFDGRAGISPPAADGQVEADLGDMKTLFAALGQPAPDLPRGLGRRVKLKGHAIYADTGNAYLRDGVITLDDNVLRGSADLLLDGARPRLNAQFKAGTLDLSALDNGASGPATPGWSKAPIDVSALGLMDAKLGFEADAIRVAGATLGTTNILITLDRSRAVIDLQKLAAYGGQASGQLIVNGRGGLSTAGNITVTGVQMQPLLADVAGYKRLIGSGDFRIKYLAVGNSLDALMRSLSGNGALKLGAGELQGLDLVGMLRNLDASYQGKGAKTIFNAITATFTIKDGVLQNDDLLLKAPLATASGKGSVNIGARTLNYRITPTALAAADGTGGYSVPVIITGPWAHPKFRPDLKALTQGKLQGAIDAGRANAKRRVEDAVGKALGVTPPPPGEQISPQEALKRKLEDAAKRSLLKKLGGGN